MSSDNLVDRKASEEEVDRPATWRDRIDDVLNKSVSWSVFVCWLTVWALYADDVRILFLPKAADLPLLITTLVILAVFLAEFVLCWLASPGYAFSMGAIMDLLAALSLIPFEELLSGIEGFGEKISVARVARAARALRILRATRAAAMALKAESRVRKARNIMAKKEASVLADTLINSTNIKMLLGILVLLLGTTLLGHTETDNTADGGLELLDRVYGEQYYPSPIARNANAQWETLLRRYKRTIQGKDDDTLLSLVLLEVWGGRYLSLPTSDIRDRDILKFETGNSSWSSRSIAWVSKESMSKREAVLSLIMTNFAVIVIMIWAWSFRRDYQRLVIAPVERMMKILKDMAMDPRQATKVKQDTGGSATEMEAIESCIGTFGDLLRVGFGEAGMGIITRNIRQSHFDPVVPGVVVQAVFGFCDIRNFTDCCEVLNEDTMIFTNNIAHIVHSLVEDSGGSVNKNIGDAFLNVWKLNENGAEADTFDARSTFMSRKTTFSHHITGAVDTCDQALFAFLRMNELLRTSKTIQSLSADPRLQRKIPGYTVRMGSGLHLGWAIEGAVGTAHKVDATYLSPHVNMAARLEAATKQYGVSILMSDALVDHFGPTLRRQCRAIDRVTVKGSVEPLTLYVHMPSESMELQDDQRASFMEAWEQAFALYQKGTDWIKAAEMINTCLEILPRDRPAKVLLDFMGSSMFKSPMGWPGYRELTSK